MFGEAQVTLKPCVHIPLGRPSLNLSDSQESAASCQSESYWAPIRTVGSNNWNPVPPDSENLS